MGEWSRALAEAALGTQASGWYCWVFSAIWGSAGPCSLIFRYILGKESLSTRALMVSPTMSHGHRPLFIKQNLIKQDLFPTKLQTGCVEGKADFFHRSSKFTDPISFIPYGLAVWPWKCFCLWGFLQEGVPVGSSTGGRHFGLYGLAWLLLRCHLCRVCWAVLKLVVLLGWMTFNQEPSWACGNASLVLQGNID